MSLRGATATRQPIGLPPARFAHLLSPLFSLRPLLLAFVCCALLTAPPARAHDPFEAFHSTTLHPDRLDLVVTMAQATALKLIDPTAQLPALTAENLPTHRPRLLRAATALFVFTSARQSLASQSATIELTDENDLIFRVTYPRPAAGPLFISAVYLRRLGDGYGGLFELTDAAGKNLGWEQLLWSRPNFEVTLPASRTPSP